jgi:glyoxylase-like metal-dependent hydrolase (beta-lactamase superfamily II)
VVLAATACTHNLQLAPARPLAASTTTGSPWASMIFAARTDSGVLLIDLGWDGAERGITRVLQEIGSTPAGVRWAFITHAHRDHIAGWRAVPQALFVLGESEVPLFSGDAGFHGLVPRLGDGLKGYSRPSPDEIRVRAVRNGPLFVMGRDTLRACSVPGHTPGSMAYRFRETLVVGDAANRGVLFGFRGALSMYSDSVPQSRSSLVSLFARLEASGVPWSTPCTAHAKCAPVDSALLARITR